MTKSSRARRRIVAPTIDPVTPERLPIAFALRDLAVAPENIRFSAPEDDGIDELAETIFAAGLLQPLTVRPGRGEEHPAMVLDGRRRWLALGRLLAAGRIGETHPVSCFVETDRTRQAAAALLTNTAVPVHVADVIGAIGKMVQARLKIPAIAAALGYAELEVRRLAALADLHPKALEALKAGRCSLRQAKLLARLPDREAQSEIAEAALNGFGFQEWRVTERLDTGQVSIHDRRFAFVGRDRYAAAGGRLESDLFGERADVVLDPDHLQAAWTARAEAIADGLVVDPDCSVVVSVDEPEIAEDELEPLGASYGLDLDSEAHGAWRAAVNAAREAQAQIGRDDLAEAARDAEIAAFLAARLAAERASEPTRAARLVTVFADPDTGLDLRVWGAPVPALAPEPDLAPDAPAGATGMPGVVPFPSAGVERPPLALPAPIAATPPLDVTGVSHGLHDLRTDVATRALIRALADHPEAALVAVVARMFAVLVLRQGVGRGGGALSLSAEPYGRVQTPPIPDLDGDVRQRLAARREAWGGSGLSPIGWVDQLPAQDRLALLAELAALSLDVREKRTSALRHGARREPAELAALCEADVSRHWTPDAGFLGAHPKSALLAMLREMGVEAPAAASARKDELVAMVADQAAARRWAPAYLNWRAAPAPGDRAEDGECDVAGAEPPTIPPAADDTPTSED